VGSGFSSSTRTSFTVRADGYKRHDLRDLDTGLISAVGITPANVSEDSVTEAISADLACQQMSLSELYIDRAYQSSTLVRERSADLQVYCKVWPVRNGTRFPKTAFELDSGRQILRCPNDQVMPFVPGGVVQFPTEACTDIPLRNSAPLVSSTTVPQQVAMVDTARPHHLA
jgi:hypothetical protein